MKSWTHPASPTLEQNQVPPTFPPHHSPASLTLLSHYPPTFLTLLLHYPPSPSPPFHLITRPPFHFTTIPPLPPSHLTTPPLTNKALQNIRSHNSPPNYYPIFSRRWEFLPISARPIWHLIENDCQLHSIWPNQLLPIYHKTESLIDILVYCHQAKPTYLRQRTTPKQNH